MNPSQHSWMLKLMVKPTLYICLKNKQVFMAVLGGNTMPVLKEQIYMTLLLKPVGSLGTLPNYTLLAAAAVVSAIETLTTKKVDIKWVNDIYLNHKNCRICRGPSPTRYEFADRLRHRNKFSYFNIS